MTKETTEINVPYPTTAEKELRITMGGCRIRIVPGDGDAWVTGTYQDPSGMMPLSVELQGSTVRITHLGNVARVIGLLGGVPTLTIALGRAEPYMLTVEAGASDNDFELGGLPITQLVVKQGAGKSRINFADSNPKFMNLLHLTAGAATMHVGNLANSKAGVMTLEGGAAEYDFEFGGALQRETYAKIDSGVSSVGVSVPSYTAAKIKAESLLAHLDVGDGFTRMEGAYWTPAAVSGNSPILRIETSVALGALRLQLTEHALAKPEAKETEVLTPV
jgi:hypothetical protein